MPNVSINFLQYGINARSAYSVNNAANAPAIGNWTAVKVDAFRATASGFAAQLYTDGQGNYRVAMRGTDELRGDLPPDVALATGRWHGQMTDAISFMGEAILQIKQANPGLSLDDIRNKIDGSGHSLGGSLYELSGKFWGTRGMNIDGPGVVGQSGLGEFSALKTEFRVKGLTELQDNYNWQPGDFQSRTYTIIGSTGSHLPGAELYVSPRYENLNLAIQDTRSFYYVPSATTGMVIDQSSAYIPLQLGSAIALHPMTAIFRSEGYADPEGSLRQQWVARNLANGLSASGYSAGSVQYEALGAGIAFQVTVIRDEQGRMVEIRVPGKLGNRTFETMGPPISSAARGNGAVDNLGITDPASTIKSVVVTAAPGLDTPARNSISYITTNGANSQSITVGIGGTISDIWLIQRNAGNKFTLEEFGRAILASNPEIADINQVRSGQIIYIPQKLVDGSVTYHYAGGTSINSNSQSGEYHMVVPNSAGGGQTVYSRTYDGNGTGGESYTVRQVQTNAAGATVFEFQGRQTSLTSDIAPLVTRSISPVIDAIGQPTEGTQLTQQFFESDGKFALLNTTTDGNVSTITASTYDANGAQTGFRQSEIQYQNTEAAKARLQDELYAGSANFLNALRAKDKLGMLLAGAKMSLDYARYMGVDPQLLDGMWGGVSATIGAISALQGLRSGNTLTQVGSAVSLLRTANTFASDFNNGVGFLSPGALTLLNQIGAGLSIAGLANVGDMIDNGQYVSAVGTTVNAINGAAYLSGATTTITGAGAATAEGTVAASGSGAFIPVDTTTLVIYIVVLIVVEVLMKEDPPPPPPTGEATFRTLANGSLTYDIANAANGGQEILAARMSAIVDRLNAQMAYANGRALTPEQITLLGLTTAQVAALTDRPVLLGGDALALIASRIPKVIVQGWPDKANNGISNFFFLVESKDPQTARTSMSGISRLDLVKHFTEALIYPQAVVNQWEVNHLIAKFGADEANWKTEGQWASAQSPIEQQRRKLEQDFTAADAALKAAKENTLMLGAWVADGAITGNVQLSAEASAAAVLAAQTAVNTAIAALVTFEAHSPAGFDKKKDPVNPQAAAQIVASTLTDPVALEAARLIAKNQWLKVIALDFGGDGITRSALPTVVKHDLITLGFTGQGDGVARFDVDNDGFQEATEWIAPSEAMLGIDRDNNGSLDSANELFNGINTPFDQRGWASLKYYDGNNDGRIDALDPVYKQLRLWFDLDGDGSAGKLEVFDLGMNRPGKDMAALRSGLDAIGKAALDALANLAIVSIDLATLKARLRDGTDVQTSEEKLQSETKGIIAMIDDATKNVSVRHEDGLRENFITLVQDMSVLLELQSTTLSATRRAELEALARKYGLNPLHADFMAVVKNLRAGGENMGGTGLAVYLSGGDVFLNKDLKQHLEQMRFSFHSATTIGGADVFGTAILAAPISAGQSTNTPVQLDPWTASHAVSQNEVTSDVATVSVISPNPEQWVDASSVFTIFDMVVKGAQLGGLVTQQALIVNGRASGVAAPLAVQVYTAAAPSLTLTAATLAGREDERFGFAYRQLELEARAQLAGAAAVTLLGVLKVDHGRVVLDEVNGRLTFVPDADYFGTLAGFSYAVRDNLGRVLERRVNFNITEVNDAPVLLGETISAREDVPLLLSPSQLLANDRDIEGDTFKIIGIGRVGMGSAELLASGQIRYLPPADLYGITDTIEYIVQDARGNSSVGVVKITLSAVADAPTVVSEIIRNAHEDTNLRIDPDLLLANDYDTDFNGGEGAQQLRITAVGNATNGQAFIDGTGHIIFVPLENFNGKATFEYTVTDLTGLSTIGKAEVEIGAVNDGPRTAGETINSQEDTRLVIDPDLLLKNETDIDIARGEAQTLRVVAVNASVNGAVALENGQVVFTPTLNFFGNAGFSYIVSDGAGSFVQATAVVKVAAVNDAPVAPNRAFSATEDTPLNISTAQLLAGIVDVESGTTGLSISAITNVVGGTLTQNAGTYTFTPSANRTGLAQFDYAVRDAAGASTKATVTLNIGNVNDAPIFLPGSLFTKTGEEDQAVRIAKSAILSMFVDVDGDALALDIPSLTAVTAGDTISFDANTNEVVFRAAPNANGIRQFNVKARDSFGALSASTTLSVNISALNDAPLVKAPGFQMMEDGGANTPLGQAWTYVYYSQLLQYASDADGDALSVIGVSGGRSWNGWDVAVEDDRQYGRVKLLAPQNYVGGIAFDFLVSDGKGGVTPQSAHAYVTPVNDLPVVILELLVDTTTEVSPGGLPILSYRLNRWDVEDGAELMTSVQSYPLQSRVFLGYALGPYLYTTSFNAEGGTWETWGVGRDAYYAGSDYLLIENLIQGSSRLESLVVDVIDSNQGKTSKAINFWAHGFDPVVIDMESNGLSFIGLNQSQVAKDRDGNGTLERLAWIKNSEAILAWDHNADGAINRMDEIEFWSHVNPQNNQLTDLQALARPEFDTNQDGKFDAADARWAQFKFWRDLNENGVSDAGELQTMVQAGVKALHLQRNVLNRVYESGVLVRGYTRLEMLDGRMLQAGDVQLVADDPTAPPVIVTAAPAAATSITAEQALALGRAQQLAEAATKRVGDPNFSGAPRDHRVLAGAAYRYQLPTELLAVPGAVVQTVITLSNGQPLPTWLTFNAATGVLSGTAPGGFAVDWQLKIQTPGLAVADSTRTMTLSVVTENQAPQVFGHLPAQFAGEDEAFSLDVAPNFFMDQNVGDALRLRANLASGASLPSWLQFDAKNSRFFGTPGPTDVGVFDIILTAVDEANATGQTRFNLIVSAVNDAPFVNNPLPIATMKLGQTTTITLPVDMFIDPDVGDSLALSVTQADGSALPNWLAFNATTRAFTGTPAVVDLAQPVKVRVTATDMSGVRTSTIVTFTSSIFGTAGNDTLVGTAFAEDLFGEAGNDSLNGGLGADTMSGGAGDDTYYVDNIGDVVVENAAEGTDTIYSTLSYILGANQEVVVLSTAAAVNATGNELNNSLYAGAGNNVIDGGLGIDTVSYNYAATGVTVSLTVSTAQATGGSGSDTLLNIEHLSGSNYNDVLTGTSGNNIIYGAAGADSMTGGAGDDTYYVDNIGDVVTELVNEGANDLVYSSIGYTLGANLERVYLTGAGVVNATGNELNNALLGHANTAANVLTGGLGDDSYYVGAGDTAVEAASAGTDTVYAYADYTLGANLENLTGSAVTALRLSGNELGNTITGNAGGDTIDGGAGNDVLNGLAGVDTLSYASATAGVTVSLALATAQITGGAGTDTQSNFENLTGSAFGDSLTGNAAANVMDGGAGIDTLVGGAGDDTYHVDSAADVITEALNEGIDTVIASVTRILGANQEKLTLTGTAAINATGNELNNVLTGNAGNNTVIGGAGADIMMGGAGNDSYEVMQLGDQVVENAGEGTDTIWTSINFSLADSPEVENLFKGGVSDFTGSGNALNNLIAGNAGNDVLDGGAGVDTVSYASAGAGVTVNLANTGLQATGGAGSDIVLNFENLTGSGFDDILSGNAENNVLNAGAGSDTVSYAGAVSGVSVNLALATAQITGGAGSDTVLNFENITGSAYNDTLTGTAGANKLDGGAGIDTLAGGAGDDTYVVDNAGDLVTEALNEGIDTVISAATRILGVNQENLILSGSAIINATGNELNNVLTGNAANNTLQGELGADTMSGGAGNDTYFVDDIGDVVVESAAEGTDTIHSTLSYILGANQEVVVLSTAAAVNATGNELNNSLYAGAGNNVIDGGLGIDTVSYNYAATGVTVSLAVSTAQATGGSGSDTLLNIENLEGSNYNDVLTGTSGNNIINGAVGADSMTGGAGDDTYYVDNIGDVVTELVNEGANDLVYSSIGYTLGANQEHLIASVATALRLSGNELNNNITGNAGGDTIDGGAGNDVLNGLAGVDTLSYALATAGVTVSLALATAQVTGGAGTDTVSNFENLTGSAFGDSLTGNAAANVMDGGAGADTLFGGAGDDLYLIDDLGDVVTEYLAAGTDLVQSSITYALSANVDNLTLTGSADINGTGNELANLLAGNSANNLLTGGAGDDTMLGGLGNDMYVVDVLTDIVIENVSEGTDTVQSVVTWALGTNFENLTLIGAASINGVGNALNNVIMGNTADNSLEGLDGNDTLNGGAGNDVLIGGAGNDSLLGGAGVDAMSGGLGNDSYEVLQVGDTVIEAAGGGIDIVWTAISYSLGAEVENLSNGSVNAFTGTGNDLDNRIAGNVGNDTLVGNLGNDVLIGGAGNDTINGGAGFDTAVFSGLKAGYTVTRGANGVTVSGADGVDLLTGIEKISFSDAITVLKPVSDFDGDGKSDILWRNTATGTNMIWKSGNSATGQAISGLTDQNWKLAGTGDFNGDGVSDILWRNTALGTNAIWKSGNAGTLQAATTIADQNWKIMGTGDFDGDGISDILWRNTAAGTNAIWKSGNSATLQAISAVTDQNWKIVGTGDFDGDGMSDILWRNTASGSITIWKSGNSVTVQNLATVADQNWKIMGSGDFNGDGNADILWRNIATGTNTIWQSGNSATPQAVTSVTDQNWKIAGTGDFDGDGKADILWRHSTTGAGTIWRSGDSATQQTVATEASQDWAIVDGLETGDLLTGGAGANTLEGTVSDDTVRGGGGNDTMSGGLGNDTYEVGETGDLIVENAGEGSDTVLTSVTYTLSANVETVILNAAGAINGTGNELANILHAGAGDNIIDGGTGIDTVVYDRSSAGVTVSLAMTGAQATGGSGSDSLLNIENLTGGNFNDILTGNAGANVLFGGVGNDFLLGGLGNDTYRFGRGYGVDTLVEDDATAGNTDVLRIDADIAHDQLWFAQSGNNLEITILGSASLVVVKDWYLGSAHRIERIESGNGKVLLESQVQNLVTAMSSFAPPVAGQLTLPSAYQTSLSPVLTTNWQ